MYFLSLPLSFPLCVCACKCAGLSLLIGDHKVCSYIIYSNEYKVYHFWFYIKMWTTWGQKISLNFLFLKETSSVLNRKFENHQILKFNVGN